MNWEDKNKMLAFRSDKFSERLKDETLTNLDNAWGYALGWQDAMAYFKKCEENKDDRCKTISKGKCDSNKYKVGDQVVVVGSSGEYDKHVIVLDFWRTYNGGYYYKVVFQTDDGFVHDIYDENEIRKLT